ncbi:hypothetical protein A1353_21275 [Methylomonas methanica]|uniref:Uncharacterized protein n=1 Tax=Methylomonas methanica TaxID=421 RepID=A0A177M092_METMH|nr:hypothetical protein [Methylomonas methanica]OAH99147.1 hypothetical protein A1353_21275 [Methylomonas methanica]
MSAFKKLLLTTTILGLIFLNIFTLADDRIHTAGYKAIHSILTPLIEQAALEQLLIHSPTKRFSELEKSYLSYKIQHDKDKLAYEARTHIVNKVAKKIVRRTVMNAIKNSSSVLGEILPFTGAIVTVAQTASDILDDCRTIQDINELNIAFQQPLVDKPAFCDVNFLVHE